MYSGIRNSTIWQYFWADSIPPTPMFLDEYCTTCWSIPTCQQQYSSSFSFGTSPYEFHQDQKCFRSTTSIVLQHLGQTGCILRCTVHILIAYSGAYSGAGHILGTYTHVHTGCILTAYWTHTHVHTSSIQKEVKLLISQMMFLSSSCAVECALWYCLVVKTLTYSYWSMAIDNAATETATGVEESTAADDHLTTMWCCSASPQLQIQHSILHTWITFNASKDRTRTLHCTPMSLHIALLCHCMLQSHASVWSRGEGEEQEGLKIHSIKGMEVLCSQGKRMYTLYWRESPWEWERSARLD